MSDTARLPIAPNGTASLVRAVDVEGVGATKTGFRDELDFKDVAGTEVGDPAASFYPLPDVALLRLTDPRAAIRACGSTPPHR